MINIAIKPLNEREAKGEKPSLDNKQSFTEVTDIRVLGNIGWVSYCYQHRPVRGAKQKSQGKETVYLGSQKVSVVLEASTSPKVNTYPSNLDQK